MSSSPRTGHIQAPRRVRRRIVSSPAGRKRQGLRAIFILDTGGHVATWNLGAERIKGYKAGEIIGQHFSIFYPAEDIAAGKTQRELEDCDA